MLQAICIISNEALAGVVAYVDCKMTAAAKFNNLFSQNLKNDSYPNY
jgi:hypothetical protein